MRRLAAAVVGAFWWCAAALLGACTGPTSAGYDAILIDATRSDGTRPADLPAGQCVVLPVLLGSRTDTRYTVEGLLAIDVSATRDLVVISVEGATSSFQKTISADQLGQSSLEKATVESATGGQFVIKWSPGCR